MPALSFLRALSTCKLFLAVIFIACVLRVSASPLPGQDDDRYVEREYQNAASPGAHELATWLIAQLRQTNNQGQNSVPPGCRYPTLVKRNSEIINSLLRLPQIDNGKK